jgi:hypothetical protein
MTSPVGELCLVAAIDLHHENVFRAGAVGDKSDSSSIGAKGRLRVEGVCGGKSEAHLIGAGRIHDPDVGRFLARRNPGDFAAVGAEDGKRIRRLKAVGHICGERCKPVPSAFMM